MGNRHPAAEAAVAPIFERWNAFTPKLASRHEMALVEGRTDVEVAVLRDPTAIGPISGLINQTQARVHGLHRKLEQGWEKMDALFDEAREDDLPDRAEADLDAAWDEMHGSFEALQVELERKWARWEMEQNAAWARALITRTHAEGGDGPASRLFYQGHGLHSICQEQAWPLREEEQASHRALQARRHPSEEDWQRWQDTARRFWTRYYEVHVEMHGTLDGTLEQAVEGRLGQMRYGDNARDQLGRGWISSVLEAAAARDARALEALVRAPAHEGLDADSAAEAIMERGDEDGAKLALRVKYDVEGEDEPWGTWLAEAMDDLRRTVR